MPTVGTSTHTGKRDIPYPLPLQQIAPQFQSSSAILMNINALDITRVGNEIGRTLKITFLPPPPIYKLLYIIKWK